VRRKPNHQHKQGKIKKSIRSGEGGEAGKQHEGRRVGWTEDSVARAGKHRRDNRGDGSGYDSVLNWQISDDRVGHPLWKGEKRDIDAGRGIRPKGASVVAAKAFPNRKKFNRVVADKLLHLKQQASQ
jgi:hypothetical protein